MFKKRVKTPTVLQMEAVECGAASLGIVLGYFGCFVPLEQLRYECGVSRNGSNAANIMNAAEKYGMEAHGYMLDKDNFSDILSEDMPLILFWKMSHFVVLEGFKGGRYCINDPAFGPRRVAKKEFIESFSQVYLQLTPGTNFTKTKKNDSLFKSLTGRVRENKKNILIAFLISTSLIIPGIVIPGLNKVFIDQFLMKGRTNYFNAIIAILIVFSISSILLNWILQSITIRLETNFLINSSYEFMRHILKLPLNFFSQRSTGDIISRLQSNSTVAEMLSQGIASNMFNLLQVVFYMLIMFLYSVELTVMMVSFTLVNIVIYQITKRPKKDVGFRVMDASAKLMGTTMVGANIIESLKSSGTEGDFFNKWSGYQTKFINTSQNQSLLFLFSESIPFLFTQISTACMLCLGAYLIIKGNLTIGELVGFSLITGQFNAPINGIVQFGNQIQQIAVDFKRIDDVLDYPTDVKFEKEYDLNHNQITASCNTDSVYKLTGKVELKNISFGYSRLEEPLIQNFNMILEPGKKIALVGMSGSGKSTIAKLISRLYQPWNGEILFDDIPIEEISPELFARSVSLVDQAPFFFKGSIRENITLWDNKVSDKTIKMAAEDAEVYDEITLRPGAFDSNINEGGSNFSGGQLQRLEIARALINDPALIILDEATSAIDPVLESRIYKNLWSRGCAFLVIAHRLSAVRDCDEIIVIDSGRIVERGIHETLMNNKGFYYKLVSSEAKRA